MIRRAVERPVSTLLGALTVVVLGVFSLLRLPVSLLPALERPSLILTAAAPGSAREEVLERITRPLEQRLGALAGVTSVRSTTGDGWARVRVESEWQTDADRLRIEAERRLAGLEVAGATLAVELAAGDPEPIVEVAVFGGSGTARAAFTREVLAPELARLEGTGRLETLGLAPLHPVVRPHAAALAARGLTAADLVARLRTVGAAVAAGRARAGAVARPLLVREDATSLDALRALRLAGPRGESVLGDVAEVGLEEVRDDSFFRLNGREGTLVRVFRAPEANAVALAARVRERVDALSRRSGRSTSGLKVEVAADRSAEVVAALKELGIAALLGLALGVAVLRFLLGRWRPTLALAVAVPASLLAAFSGFYLAGLSLDVVSLAGLALAAGLLVDSSIVVLESIETARARGEEDPEIAGARQIALPVIAGFLATAVVFLPLIYLKGLARAFFGAQAFAIVASLAASLLFSLTVTPVLARSRRSRRPRPGPSPPTPSPAPSHPPHRERGTRLERSGWSPSSPGEGGWEEAGEEGRGDEGLGWGRAPGRATYLRLLDFVLARPSAAVLAGVAVAALALLALGVLPRELVPEAAARDLVVRYRLDRDLTPEASRHQGEAVEARTAAVLNGVPASRLAVQLPGTGDMGDVDREETGRIELRFADSATAARARKRLQAALARLPGVEVWVEPRASAFVESIERTGRRLEVVASAATPERAADLARRTAERLAARAGLRESGSRRDGPTPAVLLAWDVPRLAALAGDSGQRDRLEDQVRSGLGDQTAGRVRIEGVEPEVLVKATEPVDPGLIPVSAGSGSVIPLAAVARLTAGSRPPALEREEGIPAVRRSFEGSADARRRDPEELLAGLARAADEEVSPAGQALELRRAFGQLRLALALSLVLVFLTVAALYESLATPLVVMSTVPVALGGALGLLAAAGQTLNVLSFLGLILLAGIVVNNAIVLVHRIEDHRRSGQGMDEAIRLAGAERYRPILMTTLATVAGMLPLALLGGQGVELRRALALAVIGGLTTAVFASLLLVPVLYRFAHRR
ncbi:MAG: efflux RND transporter permease subunit [Acidobacteria bacterium]|nr:efflux RND transporter permease subunit [Acidobacteriota bacterium]